MVAPARASRYDRIVRRVGILALCVLLAQSGCSAMVASMASHNSRGTSCMDEPALPAIDLIGGSLGALALVYTGTAEESPGWLVIPGVFILSGLIASATVYSCRHPEPSNGGGVARPALKPYTYVAPPDNAIPQTEEESGVRDATFEEHGMTLPDYTTPPPKVDPDASPPPTTKKEQAKLVTCRINPLTQCPEGWSCVLTDGDHGVCRLDTDFSKPNTTLPR